MSPNRPPYDQERPEREFDEVVTPWTLRDSFWCAHRLHEIVAELWPGEDVVAGGLDVEDHT
jgi:hypothetical protein